MRVFDFSFLHYFFFYIIFVIIPSVGPDLGQNCLTLWPRVYKSFFIGNSAEHEVSTAHKNYNIDR